jgi:peptidoglycan hydrolase-like protein with peptidoglycan-binding domain
MFRALFLISVWLIFLLSLLFGTLDLVFAASFGRNLSVGMSGSDVLLLQQELNKDPRTRVSATGPGSLGLETSYFGAKTAAAVQIFQELYAGEILAPVGLTQGTGFVGEKTRAKLESRLTPAEKPILPTNDAPVAVPEAISPTNQSTSQYQKGLSTWGKPFLGFPSSYEISPGDVYTVTGGGFTATNTLMFGNSYSLSGESKNGSSITVRIPVDAPLGLYRLELRNNQGQTDYAIPVVIKDKKTRSPVITAVSPTSGKYGTEITITGSGFTPTGNTILGSAGIISNIPSLDGKTLHIRIEPVPDVFGPNVQATTSLNGFTWKMRILVINPNGLTKEPGIFTFSR